MMERTVRYEPFHLERWQSWYEHRVAYNLSESGVHPLSTGELMELVGEDVDPLLASRLGYPPTNGSRKLRSRIASLYPAATPDQVVVTAGGAEANFVATWQLMEPGRPVAVVVPTYMQVPGLVRSLGGETLRVPLVEERGWEPDPGALEEAVNAGPSFILVTNPNNPLGSILSTEAMDRIVQAAERSGAWILADEVYRGAELEGTESPSFQGRYERVLVTGSLSKAYGLPGLRVGWVVAPSEVAEELWGRTDYTSIAPGALSDTMAAIALRQDVRPRILERTRSILKNNLPLVEEWARGLGEPFRLVPPQAGAVAYLGFRSGPTSPKLAERIRVEQDVLVVPGAQFGLDGFLRIGYGEPPEALGPALERVGETLRGAL